MTRSERLSFIVAAILVLAILVTMVAIAIYDTAYADQCDPVGSEECCACEPSGAAEPDPLPRLYLPSVLQRLPGMSAEFTPAQPIVTPEPDPAVTGDVQ